MGGAELLWAPDPERPNIPIGDTRLRRCLLRDVGQYATVDEYAQASGLSVGDTAHELSHLVAVGAISFEMHRGHVFVLSAPEGRPSAHGQPDVAPNLWELLRRQCSIDSAYDTWRAFRTMSRRGWRVTPLALAQTSDLHLVQRRTPVAAEVLGDTVDLLVGHDVKNLVSRGGVLDEYCRAGVGCVVITCPAGHLDLFLTHCRKWLAHRFQTDEHFSVVIAEAPSYQPVLISSDDAAVVAFSVETPTK